MRYQVYRPSMTGNEKKYVNECIDTSWTSSKCHFVEDFEKAFSKYIGVQHATGVCNGTVAIQVAVKALEIAEDDEVICPTFTYIASANPIKEAKAKVVFVDSLADSWQMDPDDIEKKITEKTKAIMVVHLYGHPCNMSRIMDIARQRNLFVIEDCAESIGSEYKNRKVGSFGDIACFSFFGNKTITCGEGGMVLTDNDHLYDKILKIKGQGLAKDREYWHDALGFNFRMTNIQAAIGLAQFEQIQEFVDKKRTIADWYKKYLEDVPVKLHSPVGDVKHTYWMNSILVENSAIRQRLREYMKEKGIETRPTFYPVHTMPIYSRTCENYPVAENIALKRYQSAIVSWIG